METEVEHPNVILHFDIDCFYAQVEMVRNPTLKDKPLGIKQKSFMVTCNYAARSLGVSKTMRISEVTKAFPDLILIDGSDLTHYRHFSSEIFTLLRKYSKNVEKLGLDENFVDVTDILDDYVSNSCKIEGFVFRYDEDFDIDQSRCQCGCYDRLLKGCAIAKIIRDDIFNSLGITTCAGIAYNKLLAKLVCGHKKPNNQTVVFPSQVDSVMKSLKSLKNIPSIGYNTLKILQSLNINTIKDLQECPLSTLNKKLDSKFSQNLKFLSYGIDYSKVKSSGPSLTLSVEDAVKKVSTVSEVKEKLKVLIDRILILLEKDGRFPNRFRLIIRKFERDKEYGQRIMKDIDLPSSLFGNLEKLIVLPATVSTLNDLAFDVFKKVIDISRDFHITLLGVGFSKFFERETESHSILKYFTKKIATDNNSSHTDLYDPNSSQTDINIRSFENATNKVKENLSSTSPFELDQLHSDTFDAEVFDSLPLDIKKEFQTASTSTMSEKSSLSDCFSTSKPSSKVTAKKCKNDKQQKIDLYFSKSDSDMPRSNINGNSKIKNPFGNVCSQSSTSAQSKPESSMERRENNNSGENCDNEIERKVIMKGMDFNVFKELPQEIKDELLADI
ncbi:UNVERIFIED_CONTAM: hypothetical protein RMT77_018693 [Armadillidium vulgare]